MPWSYSMATIDRPDTSEGGLRRRSDEGLVDVADAVGVDGDDVREDIADQIGAAGGGVLVGSGHQRPDRGGDGDLFGSVGLECSAQV